MRLAQRPVAGDGARLQPHRPLPRLAERLVVGEQRGQRQRERTLPAARPQAQVDAEAEAVRRHLGERARHLLGHADEELAHGASVGQLAVALVDVDQIDVGAVVELAAAELAHAEDDEGDGQESLTPLLRQPLRGYRRAPPR